jgi:hypothetical protein
VGGVWFVKMGGGTNGKCVVWMRDGMEIWFVVAHDKTNGQWEGWGLMGRDELRDMGWLVPMRKKA